MGHPDGNCHPTQVNARDIGTRSTYCRGIEGWVDLGGWLCTEMVYLSAEVSNTTSKCTAATHTAVTTANEASISNMKQSYHVTWNCCNKLLTTACDFCLTGHLSAVSLGKARYPKAEYWNGTFYSCPFRSMSIVHGCPPSGLPCSCCPYLQQSAPTRHVRTLYVCFPRSPQGFPLQAFLPMTFTTTFVVQALHSDCCYFRTLKP